MNIVGAIAGQSINGKVGTAAIRYVKDADLYPAIAAYLEDHGVTGATPEQIAAAVEAYLLEHPIEETDPTVPDWAKQPEKPSYTADEVGALSAETLPEAINTALAQAKASGEFDGKSTYQYAVEGGYTGTDAEFAAKLAQEIPTALPNPNALTFTGAVSATYDGSMAVSVEIPSAVTDDHISSIIDAKLGVIENGSY